MGYVMRTEMTTEPCKRPCGHLSQPISHNQAASMLVCERRRLREHMHVCVRVRSYLSMDTIVL